MASKFGGIPVESTSKFGGIPVPVDTPEIVTEVESTYGGGRASPVTPGTWEDFMSAAVSGFGRKLPGQALLHETEPRVLVKEDEFVPLLGRVPVLGKLWEKMGITQTTPTKRSAFVWAPPGTEERAREMYPNANIQQVPEGDRESAIAARDAYEAAKGTIAGKRGLGTGGIIGDLAKMALMTGGLPPAISNWGAAAKGALTALPSAAESLELGKPVEAVGKVGGLAAGSAALNALANTILYKGFPKELLPTIKRVKAGIEIGPEEIANLEKVFGVVDKLPPSVSQEQLAEIFKASGLGKPILDPLSAIVGMAKEHPRVSGALGGAAASSGMEAMRGGDAMDIMKSGAAGGVLGGLRGQGVLSGAGMGSLPAILRAIMQSGYSTQDVTGGQ